MMTIFKCECGHQNTTSTGHGKCEKCNKPNWEWSEEDNKLLSQLSVTSKQAVNDLRNVHGIDSLRIAVDLEKNSGKVFK